MILTLKNKILFALLYGIYHLLIQFFFNSFQFLENPNAIYSFYLALFFIVSLVQFLFFYISVRLNKMRINFKASFSFSFLISGLLASSIIWILFSYNYHYYFTFIFSFIVTSFLPSVSSLFYFFYIETFDKFSKISSISLKNIDSEDSEVQTKLFHLENPNGKVLLEVPLSKIVCFEANDNYVVTYYLKDDSTIAKSMERVSLKKIEEMLDDENMQFKRVHKSYLININFLDEIKGRAQAYKIKMLFYPSLIPVSRSYNINELKV